MLLVTHKNTRASKYMNYYFLSSSIFCYARSFQKRKSLKVLCVLVRVHVFIGNHKWAITGFKVFPLRPLFPLPLKSLPAGILHWILDILAILWVLFDQVLININLVKLQEIYYVSSQLVCKRCNCCGLQKYSVLFISHANINNCCHFPVLTGDRVGGHTDHPQLVFLRTRVV